jgi:hypothetical protein
MYNEFGVLWLTNREINNLLKRPLLQFTNIPGYLIRTINQSKTIKTRPHIYNPIANIPDAFLPGLNEKKKTKCQTTGKIFSKKCLGIIIKGEDIQKIHESFPGFITDFKLTPIII